MSKNGICIQDTMGYNIWPPKKSFRGLNWKVDLDSRWWTYDSYVDFQRFIKEIEMVKLHKHIVYISEVNQQKTGTVNGWIGWVSPCKSAFHKIRRNVLIGLVFTSHHSRAAALWGISLRWRKPASINHLPRLCWRRLDRPLPTHRWTDRDGIDG